MLASLASKGLRAKLRTAAVMARLCCAQLLVSWIPFGRWKDGLGFEAPDDNDAVSATDVATHLAADVDWAARRLPFPVKCLPRAMALSWMLRRVRIGHAVVIAVRPSERRQSNDALHAWLEVNANKVMGDLPGPWIETVRLDGRTG